MSSNSTPKTNKGLTVGLIALAFGIAAFPMFFNLGDKDAEEQFTGTDDGAETIVEEENPDYEPWFNPLIGELPGEVESGLFALQAGLGAGVVGYALGSYRGRRKAEEALGITVDATGATS
ncbi:energy-coupling factor ABC transporter substrate-binding protein [Corynebacterium aquilae]|uniref:Cobalt transport protein CbiN n=1 Tax=Corynebacterium aquilae DSM 44791 TaxID=1431546 RepID=A0A1L7CHR8_9CORY|nr:energy-coupling factor ABC transporter substrate-binding protein [Corynebacterium aquilae]APT85378.1 cobalt transport protein CbiN [Corynebacterium aquilae DSM 44791]